MLLAPAYGHGDSSAAAAAAGASQVIAGQEAPAGGDVVAGPAGTSSFDANVVMILAVLLCALICALGLNSIVRCALRCSSGGRMMMSSSSSRRREMTASWVRRRRRRPPGCGGRRCGDADDGVLGGGRAEPGVRHLPRRPGARRARARAAQVQPRLPRPLRRPLAPRALHLPDVPAAAVRRAAGPAVPRASPAGRLRHAVRFLN